MKHLIIYAHPNPNSFNRAILDNVIKASEPHSVIVRDLNDLEFNPTLSWQECLATFSGNYAEDVSQEHQYWQQADLITLIYPLWWMGFPAVLKGYLDRVLTYGFAYKNGENESIGLLKGKKMQHFVTMGNTNEKYAQKGFLKSLNDTLGNGLFNFCGIENVQIHFLGGVGIPTTDYPELLQELGFKTKSILKNT